MNINRLLVLKNTRYNNTLNRKDRVEMLLILLSNNLMLNKQKINRIIKNNTIKRQK